MGCSKHVNLQNISIKLNMKSCLSYIVDIIVIYNASSTTLGSDHLTSRGGGVGFLVRLEYFFYMFSETEIFFQHHRGLDIFFLPM